jgi:hypothetical protein
VGDKSENNINVKTKVFWDVAESSLVEIDPRFTGAYCLHHQGSLQVVVDVFKMSCQMPERVEKSRDPCVS